MAIKGTAVGHEPMELDGATALNLVPGAQVQIQNKGPYSASIAFEATEPDIAHPDTIILSRLDYLSLTPDGIAKVWAWTERAPLIAHLAKIAE